MVVTYCSLVGGVGVVFGVLSFFLNVFGIEEVGV